MAKGKSKTISNQLECQSVELDKLKSMDAALKQAEAPALKKLRQSILANGMIFPVFVWKKGKSTILLDGIQRVKILHDLRTEGYTIDPVPVVYIKAKNQAEAVQCIYLANSHYSKFNQRGYVKFTSDMQMDRILSQLNLVGLKVSEPEMELAPPTKNLDTTVQFLFTDQEMETVHNGFNKLAQELQLDDDLDILDWMLDQELEATA